MFIGLLMGVEDLKNKPYFTYFCVFLWLGSQQEGCLRGSHLSPPNEVSARLHLLHPRIELLFLSV